MDIEVSSILQLNDDCLWCIFSYFDFLELFTIGSVCQRFEGIAQMFYKNCQSINITELNNEFYEKGIRHPGLGEVFRQLEPQMIAMKLCGYFYENIFGCPKFSILNFPNLQHIMLAGGTKIHEEYAKMFPALKQIVLQDVYIRDESVLSSWFNNSPHLKILKFSLISNMTGQCLVGLKGIEELKIDFCRNIQPKFFEQFCQMNTHLKKLSLQLSFNTTIRSNTFLEIITNYLKNLESLVIRDKVDDAWIYHDILRDLPKVTKLRLDMRPTKYSLKYNNLLEHFATNNHIEYLNLSFAFKDVLNIRQQFLYLKVLKVRETYKLSFEKISNFISCSTTLEELHIVGCNFKSSAGLKDFIEKYNSLRLLHVYASNNFNSSFLIEIEESLQNRTQMLEIRVNLTDLAWELQEESKSEFLMDFLERTKEKLKFTIDAFDSKLARMPKKSFHECEEWEKLNRYL